jgi:hypothetical protein
LSLDPDDDDPTRFWQYVVAASIGSARASAINCCHYRAVRAGGHGAVTALINQIEA